MIISSLILYQILLAGTLYFNKVLLSRIAKNLNTKEKWNILLNVLSHINTRKVKRIFGDNTTNYLPYMNHQDASNDDINHAIMIHEEPLLFHDDSERKRRKNSRHNYLSIQPKYELEKYKLFMN